MVTASAFDVDPLFGGWDVPFTAATTSDVQRLALAPVSRNLPGEDPVLSFLLYVDSLDVATLPL